MRPFKPAEEYKMLLKQARALWRLSECLEKQLSFHIKEAQESILDMRNYSIERLDSELEMNAILTQELMDAEDRIKVLEEKLGEQNEVRREYSSVSAGPTSPREG